MPESRAIITYRRVSTAKQDKSKLGLEAQEEAVRQYAAQHGCRRIATYTEVESGKRADRPELAKAIAHAKRSKAVLVVAKLDRLARNVAFLSSLMESGIEFIACDNPNANRLTIHILAAVAEDEVRAISQRTKDALAAYKAKGGKLGGRRENARKLTADDRRKGTLAAAQSIAAKARDAYADLILDMKQWRASGRTLQSIACALNEQGHTTRQGKAWGPVQVKRVLDRC